MTWSKNCDIYLCLKGIFIVQFDSQEELEKVFKEAFGFREEQGFSSPPWFPKFDSSTMMVKNIPVWVRFPKPPLPFLHHKVIEGVGNILGSFKNNDVERT